MPLNASVYEKNQERAGVRAGHKSYIPDDAGEHQMVEYDKENPRVELRVWPL